MPRQLNNVAKTKIVATIGPSSNNKTTLTKMLSAGMSVARFNMSHGNHESHARDISLTRKVARATKRPLAILQDLSGPKIRIGDFSTETVLLEEEKDFTLTTKKCTGDMSHAHVTYKKLPQEVSKGMYIFLNDGKVQLKVTDTTNTEIHTTIIVGGTISGRRGVNVPDANFSFPALTAKDRKDLAFGIKQGVDIVTLSFVRDANDIKRLRKLLVKTPHITVVAKIETKAAITNLDKILEEADALMVARGDLAIEVRPEKVPLLQKQIIRAANRAGKPVITATQMLDSMRVSTVPTRAEVNDVANAILDGTDAVMLSDETAVGDHPNFAVRSMIRIAQETENNELFHMHRKECDFEPITICDQVSRSISKAVENIDAKAIVAFSESGYTGRMVARYRPHVPILVLTPNTDTFSKSLLTYGCQPVRAPKMRHTNDARRVARKILLQQGLAKSGDIFVLGAGIPFGKPGATNMMLVEHL